MHSDGWTRRLGVAGWLAAWIGWGLLPCAWAGDDVALRLRANLARFDALCRDTSAAPAIRVLIYGQSITGRPWTTAAFQPLQQRYPGRSWVVENRCIGGTTAAYLARTAEADVFTFHPDLVVFHAYGNTHAYASFVTELRRRTTADILLINDPYALWDASDFPGLGDWSGRALPGLALANGAAMVDVRRAWRDLLVGSSLPLDALLLDHVHPNPLGESVLMNELSNFLLQETGAALRDPFNDDRVAGVDLPPDAAATGTWTMAFTGNRVVALAGPGKASVRVDGVAPSSLPTARVHGRASPWPGSGRPFVVRIGNEGALVDEVWTLRIDAVDGPRGVRFSVMGSVTGPDGSGTSAALFRSASGRVRIAPEDWFWEALDTHLQPGMTFSWTTISTCVDVVSVASGAPPRWMDLVAGLQPGRHELRIRQAPGRPTITRVLVYSPPEPRPARVRARVEGGSIVAVDVVDPGYRYGRSPAVSFPEHAGTPAFVEARADEGVVTSVQVLDGGSGYPADVVPVVDEPERPPRVASARVEVTDGRLEGFQILNVGRGYDVAPTVTFEGGNGAGAAAKALVWEGGVVGVEWVNQGKGYQQPPNVRFSPPPPPPPLRVEPLPMAVRLRIETPPPGRIEASTDLSAWSAVGVFTNAHRPFLELPAPDAMPWRFFRVVTP